MLANRCFDDILEMRTFENILKYDDFPLELSIQKHKEMASVPMSCRVAHWY